MTPHLEEGDSFAFMFHRGPRRKDDWVSINDFRITTLGSNGSTLDPGVTFHRGCRRVKCLQHRHPCQSRLPHLPPSAPFSFEASAFLRIDQPYQCRLFDSSSPSFDDICPVCEQWR
jgi:hypothetical protein